MLTDAFSPSGLRRYTMLKKLNLSFCCWVFAIFTGASGTDEQQDVTATKESKITLDGKNTRVFFNDGDTFKVLNGKYENSRIRIGGYNTLETYGPVHSWVDNTPEDLFEVAIAATHIAQKGKWNCQIQDGVDAYGRHIARCDDLALELLRKGLAHAYSVDKKKAYKKYLKGQALAQKEGLGLWAGGIPDEIITSLHSAEEGAEHTYNRLISTKDGSSTMVEHEKSYATCEKVCIEQGNSCMIYVPYNERYGRNRSECLHIKKSEQ
jgi:micrococcal nuclease